MFSIQLTNVAPFLLDHLEQVTSSATVTTGNEAR
jgi:hypothetical protein